MVALKSSFGDMLTRHVSGFSLEQDFYTSQAIYDFDLEHIFYKQWLFAIPACELQKSGDFVLHQVGAFSVILVLGEDKVIRAFHNTCRHRGSVICKSRKGRNPKLVCPYHQWTYDLDGKLLWARDMGEDFNPDQYGLKPVHCRNVSGLIYICLAEVAPDIEVFSDVAGRYLAPHDLENSKVAYESTIIENANWKLVWENNRECYHCGGNHPSLCRTFPEDARLIGNIGDGSIAPLMEQHVKRCEAVGAPSALITAKDGNWRFVRPPLLGAGESYTMDTKSAVEIPNSSIPFKDAGSLLYFNLPTTWNHFMADHSLVFRVSPISATETEICTKWLVHKDAEEGRHYDLNRLTEVWLSTNAEDKEVVENNQKGIQSPAYEPGPYSEIQEGGVIQFTDWYMGLLSQEVLGESMVAAE
ncbi:aromatic ring-hydroxylating oxygenase subunit alpha [Sneathiella limimaris]|uniref:aromatic ring-hydroxylating oxygenase subunit alpha n=1 Tax=Sneathiella limimaris TaxID=1964213 RepID=UPI0019D05A00|nr:aromatic ring-hydroxylating dioxygenase subunit alpha [Sneathiella limimaris]